MKTANLAMAGLISIAFAACTNSNNDNGNADSLAAASGNESEMQVSATAQVVPGSYTDLNTGREVYVVADPETGWAIDSVSRTPIEFYIDRSGDTLYRNGLVVNYAIERNEGKWRLNEAKIKRDGDDIKIKYPDGDKIKMEPDEMKIKGQEGKIKIDDDTVKVKAN